MRAAIGLFALALLAAGCGTAPVVADEPAPTPQPDPTGVRWTGVRDAPEVDLAAMHPRSGVLLVFWATWCRPCKAEIPHVGEFARLTAGRRISVIGVSIDTERSDLDAFLAARPLPYGVLHDPALTVAKRFQAESTPTIVGLDGTGAEVFRSDRMPENPAGLADLLERGTVPQ